MAVEAGFFSENMVFSQDWMITANPGFLPPIPPPLICFNQQQQQKPLEQGMGMGFNVAQENFSFPSSSTTTSTTIVSENCFPFVGSQNFSDLLDKQKREVDLYLHIQGERLKEVIQQHRRQQMQFLINSFESKSMALLKEKEEDLEKLRLNTRLLEEYLKKTEEEAEMWQKIAKEKEEMVIGLNNMFLLLQQNLTNLVPQQNNNIINNNNINNSAEEDNYDAESVCDCQSLNNNNNNRRGEMEEIENEDEMKKKINVCKWCNYGLLGVVFLPCKHLCCCKTCEPLLGFCPVCHSVKQGSLEIFFS